MKTIALCLMLLASPFFLTLTAQSLAGEYVLASEEGEIILQLEEDGQNQLAGSLKDTDGALYRVQARVQNEDAFGTLTNPQAGLYFEAYLQGEQLILSIMPADAYNQPDYLNAKEFVLSRRKKAVSPIDFSRPPAEKKPESGSLDGQHSPGLYGQWEGAYYGEINETPSKLSLLQYGNQLSGEIDADGYKYGLEGTISGNRSQGDAWDPQKQLSMKFSGILSGNMALITLSAAQGQFEMQFFREGTKPPLQSKPDPAELRDDPKMQQTESLAGSWFYTKPNESGEFGSKRMQLLLMDDGAFKYGDDVEVSKEAGGRVGKGQWKVQDNALLINQGKGWVKFADYQPGNGTLLRKLSDGKAEQWERY